MSRQAPSFGIACSPDTSLSGTVRTDVKANGSTSNPELTGAINARDLKISGKDVPQPVAVQAIDLELSPPAIRSNDFTATSGTTDVAARFAVRRDASPSPSGDVGPRAAASTLPGMHSLS